MKTERKVEVKRRNLDQRMRPSFKKNKRVTLTMRALKQIREAILAVQDEYERNIFPFMKADWSDYPNDIGHFTFRGCMRCHDGKHSSRPGILIPNDCRTCHVIIAQGPKMTGREIITENGLEFKHPVDIGDAWKEGHCYVCHQGTQP